MTARPCIERDPVTRKGCVRYALPGGSRCRECESERAKNRTPSPSQRVVWSARWKRVRASVIRKRRRPNGTWVCQICHQPIASATEIDVDHVVPVSDGGAAYDESNLRMTHRRCNRRAGGLRAAEQRKQRRDETLYFQRRRKSCARSANRRTRPGPCGVVVVDASGPRERAIRAIPECVRRPPVSRAHEHVRDVVELRSPYPPRDVATQPSPVPRPNEIATIANFSGVALSAACGCVVEPCAP